MPKTRLLSCGVGMTETIYSKMTDNGLMQEITDSEDRLLRAIDNSNLGTAGQEVSLLYGLDMELMDRYKRLQGMYTKLLEKGHD